jgi:hypothetical protein
MGIGSSLLAKDSGSRRSLASCATSMHSLYGIQVSAFRQLIPPSFIEENPRTPHSKKPRNRGASFNQ